MDSTRDIRNATSATTTGVINLRQRLFGQRGANNTLSENLGIAPSSRSRPSTISFFRKLQAGFRAKNDFQVPPRDREYEQFLTFNQRVPLTGRPSYGSSSATDSSLINELKDDYVHTAQNLHEQVSIKLATAQHELEAALFQVLAKDAAVLTAVEEQHRIISQPFPSFQIESEEQAFDGSQDTRRVAIANLVANARKELGQGKGELSQLWSEWEAAQKEIETTLSSLTGRTPELDNDPANDRKQETPEDEPNGLESILEEFRAEMKQIRTDLESLATGNMTQMKKVEKDFQRAIQRDFFIFHRSLLE